MRQLSNFFYQKSAFAIALIATIVTFGYLYLVMMDVAKCFEIAGNTESLGLSFGLTDEMVQRFFAPRSEEMILCFKDLNAVWDNVFALLYGLMYVLWLSLLFQPYASRTKWLNLFPLTQTIFDWFENSKLVDLANSVLRGQEIASSDVQWASFFSMAKWTCSSLIFLFLLIGIGLKVKTAFKK